MSNFRILVAEDNEMNQKLIQVILEKSGFQFFLVDDGNKAVEMYQNEKFDLILMDCQMPILDGLSATKIIREFEKQNHRTQIPIVALTANSMKGDREKCLESGMNDFLSKPFKMNELVETIKNWQSQNEKGA